MKTSLKRYIKRFRPKRPVRNQLAGYSRSELKTLLRVVGFKVPRDFFESGCVATYRNRQYRFRWWSDEGFLVDISCLSRDFDRWANSTDDCIDFADFLVKFNKKCER